MRKLHPHQDIKGLRGLTVEDFWIWAYSDLLTNVTRNAFAEFMVGFALARLHLPRTGIDPTLFHYRDKTVAVRAAAYTQSAPQKQRSKVNFNLSAPRGQKRPDCYVFSLFTYENYNDKDAARDALLDASNWRFYVVPDKVIRQNAASNKTMGVSWMDEHTPKGAISFEQLKERIDEILGLPS